jgi:hypothetical protein
MNTNPIENRLPKDCCYCGGPAEGISFIRRDGPDKGLELPLCESCAGPDGIEAEAVWLLLAARQDGNAAWQEYTANRVQWWANTDALRRERRERR